MSEFKKKEKAKDLKRYLKIIDLVFELVDARCPISSRSHHIEQYLVNKHHLIILNKADLADRKVMEQWLFFLKKQGKEALAVNSRQGQGFREIWSRLNRYSSVLNQELAKKGQRSRELRTGVLGVPNVGKSTFINKMIGRRVTPTGDRPGVTKGLQWVHLRGKISLLDTPGILPPKTKIDEINLKLAAIGVLSPDAYDPRSISEALAELLQVLYPGRINSCFGMDTEIPLFLEALAQKKKFLLPGEIPDLDRAARFFLTLFQNGKLGLFTLEKPES